MTSPASWIGGARRVHVRAALVLLVLLSLLPIRSVSAQPPQEQKYFISIGTAAERLPSGTLWLYSYSWYGLLQFKLATIQDGVAIVSLDADRLKREADPHPETSAYVLVIQSGEHQWRRTPDIPPDNFWADLSKAIHALGKTERLSSSETQLILPPLAKRRITLLDPAGRPKANTDLTVSIYLWDQNHCGGHQGLPLGAFRTDAKGTVEVLAPLVPLYLDGLQYFEEAGSGPGGPAYSGNTGMKTAAGETVVIQTAWSIPQFTVRLQVLTSSGKPRPHVDVYADWNQNTCGGSDRVAETDARGMVELDLDATFTALTLMVGGPYTAGDPAAERNTRELTNAELRELFSKHRLTIRWDPVPKPVAPMLARPMGYWTSVPVDCHDVSGKWADPENPWTWTWTLNQVRDNIAGSLTVAEGNCGIITWQVAGKINGGVATLTATSPEPPLDKCGAAPTARITAARKPYCQTREPR